MTGVDLDVEIGAWLVAALPDGQAVTATLNNNTVVRVNKQGVIVNNLYTATGSDFYGLLVQGSHLFVLHLNGTVVQMQPEDGLILNVYNTGISGLYNYGSHHTDHCDIDLDVVLLPAISPGNVYTYNISSQTLKTRVNNLNRPISVTHSCVDGSVVYVVCELYACKVRVYNASWSLITSFGELGTGNGQLKYPHSALMSDGYIFVADTNNHRVSMFTSDGQFVKHIITYKVPYYEGQAYPVSLSVRGKYLWVATSNGRLTRYIL